MARWMVGKLGESTRKKNAVLDARLPAGVVLVPVPVHSSARRRGVAGASVIVSERANGTANQRESCFLLSNAPQRMPASQVFVK